MSKIRLRELANSYISEQTLKGIENIEIESGNSSSDNQIHRDLILPSNEPRNKESSHKESKEQIEVGIAISNLEASFKADGLLTILLKRFVIASVIVLITSIITLVTSFLN